MFNSKTEKALIWSSNIDQHCTGHCESKIAKLAVVIINRLFCERTRNLVISESLSSIILFGFLYFESSIKPSAFTALKHSKYPMISEFNKIRPINLSGGCLGYSLVYTSVGEKCIRLITCLTHSDVPNCFSAPSQRSKIHFSPRRSKFELLRTSNLHRCFYAFNVNNLISDLCDHPGSRLLKICNGYFPLEFFRIRLLVLIHCTF